MAYICHMYICLYIYLVWIHFIKLSMTPTSPSSSAYPLFQDLNPQFVFSCYVFVWKTILSNHFFYLFQRNLLSLSLSEVLWCFGWLDRRECDEHGAAVRATALEAAGSPGGAADDHPSDPQRQDEQREALSGQRLGLLSRTLPLQGGRRPEERCCKSSASSVFYIFVSFIHKSHDVCSEQNLQLIVELKSHFTQEVFDRRNMLISLRHCILKSLGGQWFCLSYEYECSYWNIQVVPYKTGTLDTRCV